MRHRAHYFGLCRGANERERESAEVILRQAFDGRKGHGGAPITRRVVRERELRAMLLAALAFNRLRRDNEPRVVCRGVGGVATKFAARHGIHKCANPNCPNPVDARGADGTDGMRCEECAQ